MKVRIFLSLTSLLLFTSAGMAETNYSANIIPKMSSDTSPAGVVSPLSSLAWPAFDHLLSGEGYSKGWMPGPAPQWLQYQFTAGPKRVSKYRIQGCPKASVMGPRTWTFQGSDNGTDWTVLDAQAGIVFLDSEAKDFEIPAPGNYSYYKLDITEKTPPADSTLMIDEVEMYEDASPAR